MTAKNNKVDKIAVKKPSKDKSGFTISTHAVFNTIKWVLLLLLIYLQAILWIGEGSLADVSRLKQSAGEMEKQNEQLQARNLQLLREVESLREGTDLIEHRAREELGLVKEDELFFYIIRKQPQALPEGKKK